VVANFCISQGYQRVSLGFPQRGYMGNHQKPQFLVSTAAPRRKPLVRAVFAALLCFGIAAGLITVTLTTVRLTDIGTYSSTGKTVYTTVVTLMATILTTFILGTLRFAFLDMIDARLAGFAQAPTETQNRVQSRWQTILALGGIPDSIRNPGIASTMVLGALVTTCITAGLTPTTTTRIVPYSPLIPSSDPYVFALPLDNLTNSGSRCVLNWPLPNGSHFCSSVWYGDAPQKKAFRLLSEINIDQPDDYAYSDLGVAVRPSAIGIPVTLYDPQRDGYGLRNLLQTYGPNIVSATACAPVMTRCPVKCYPGGTITYPGGNTMRLASNDGKCVAQKKLDKKKEEFVMSLARVCPYGEVGQATFVLGAANSIYAQWVAATIGERIASPFPGQTYSVQCDIDVRSAFDYRLVSLSINNNNNISPKPKTNDLTPSSQLPLSFNRILSSTTTTTNNNNNKSCPTPPGAEIPAMNALFSTIAMAPYYIQYEVDNTGWIQPLVNIVSRYSDYGHNVNDSIRTGPFAFSDASNALEDGLGLLGAMAGSRAVLNMSLVRTTQGEAEVTFTRVGPGELFALVYAMVPAVLGIILLGFVFAPRCRDGHGADLKSSRLVDLVRLGLAAH